MSKKKENIFTGISDRNQTDYRSFFDQYYKSYCQFANRFINDYESSRDIVQDSFIKAWKNMGEFNEINHLKSYLYKTIHCRCINHIRNLNVAAKNNNEIEYLSSGLYYRNTLIEEEIYSSICRKIEELPDMQREVIQMHIEGLTNVEIAKKLNVAINTIRTHKQRAKAALKSELKDLFGVFVLVFLS